MPKKLGKIKKKWTLAELLKHIRKEHVKEEWRKHYG
jgi:hypothetical protein